MNSLPVLDPQSPEARSIFIWRLFSAIILRLIFVIVAGIIVYSLMRFRWREGEADPAARRQQNGGNYLDGHSVPDRHRAFRAHRPHDEPSDPPPAPEPDFIVITGITGGGRRVIRDPE